MTTVVELIDILKKCPPSWEVKIIEQDIKNPDGSHTVVAHALGRVTCYPEPKLWPDALQ